MNATLYRGNTPVVRIPFCDGGSLYRMPPAQRIAAEYGTGVFTLGLPINPRLMPYQRDELAAAELAVDDHIEIMTIPEEHTVSSLYFAVDEGDTAMAGAAVTLSGLLYDNAAKTFDEVTEIGAAATAQGVTNLVFDATSGNFVSLLAVASGYAVPYTVPRGKTLILTLKIVSLPTDTNYSFSAMRAIGRYVAKADGYDIPTQM